MRECSIESASEVIVHLDDKKPIRILHVDDETSLLKIAKQCLEMEEHFQVDLASSVDEAIRKMKEESYDAVISDYQMPGKDGLMFLKELRNNGNDVPFIIFTGRGREEVAIKALNLGADQYVNKSGCQETVYGELAYSINHAVGRKRAENRIRESEERFRKIFETASDAIIYLDKKGRILGVNNKAEEIFGGSKEELIGKNFARIGVVHIKDIPALLKAFARGIAGKPARLNVHIKNKKGEELLLESSASTMKIDGEIVTMVIARDVTERKKAAEALQESERKFRLAFENAKDAIFWANPETGLIINCNKAAETLLETDRGKILGHRQTDLHPPQKAEYYTHMFKRHIEQNGAVDDEAEIITNSGKIKPVHITASVTVVGEKPIIQGIFRDITERKKAEETLRENQEKLKAILSSSPDAITVFDLDGNVIELNQAAMAMHNFSKKEEIIGKSSFDFVSPKDLHKARKTFKRTLEQGCVRNIEFNLLTKEGQEFLVELSANVVPDAFGSPSYIVAVMRDITVRRKSDEELKDSVERLGILFECAPDAYYLSDLKGNFVDGNKRAEEITGYTRHELIGKSFLKLNLLPRDQLPKASRLLLLNALGKPTGPDEFLLNRKDRSQIPVEIRTVPVRFKNRSIVLGIARDIGERKETEKLRVENQQKFEALFRRNPEAAVHVGPDFCVLDVNSKFEELFGYRLDEIKGRNINKVVVPKDKIDEAQMLDHKAEQDKHVSKDTVRMKKDGSLIPVFVSAAPIAVEGKFLGYMAVYKDISKLKNTESKLEAMNEKLRVTGGLTRHDVRNKLSIVTGNVYLLKKQLIDNRDILEKLREMENAVHQATQIFDFARAYEMLGVEDLSFIDVAKTLDEAVSLFPGSPNVKVVNECVGLVVLTDSLLRQLLYNLIDNSLRHGKKTSKIRVYYEKCKGELKLFYEDDGVGISATKKHKLFKEGYSTGIGTGYGLYLIKKIVEVYDWTIQETGIPGQGAQFIITIPQVNRYGKENYRTAWS